MQYTWTFGDGESGDGEVVYHKYDEPGEYEVVLVVMDDDGLTDRVETTLSIADIRTPTPTVETDDDGPLKIVKDLAPRPPSSGPSSLYSAISDAGANRGNRREELQSPQVPTEN